MADTCTCTTLIVVMFVLRAYVNLIDLTVNTSDEENEEDFPCTSITLASKSNRTYVCSYM